MRCIHPAAVAPPSPAVTCRWLSRSLWMAIAAGMAGDLRAFACNSPFVPGLAKYSEVQIPIEPTATP